MENKIQNKALLVYLNVRGWSARRYDRKVSNKTTSDHGASREAGRFNKFLLPNCKSFKALERLSGSIRQQHYDRTLAWSDDGWRLLPSASYFDYTDWFRQQSAKFQSAVGEFVEEYRTFDAISRQALGTMHNDQDYPAVEKVRSKWGLDYEVRPIPLSGDIRVELSPEDIAEIESSMQNRVEGHLAEAVKDTWERLHSQVSHMAERLSGDNIFRDSLIENARELCASLKTLNVIEDPKLEEMRARVEAELTKHEPDMLRDNKAVRGQVAQSAEDILTAMKEVYGERI